MATSALAPLKLHVDFLSCLPSVAVVKILSYLKGEDCVHCLSVSKSWRETVCSFPSYWRKACLEFGLPEDLIRGHTKEGESPVNLFVVANKQRQLISSGSPVILGDLQQLTCPESAAVNTNQIVNAGNGIVAVVTIDRSVSSSTHMSLSSHGASYQGTPILVFNPPKCVIKEIILFRNNKTTGHFQPFTTLCFPGRWSLLARAYTHEHLHWIVLILRNSDDYTREAYFKVSLQPPTTVYPKINVSYGGGTYTSCCQSCSLMVAVSHRTMEKPPWTWKIDILEVGSQSLSSTTVPIYHLSRLQRVISSNRQLISLHPYLLPDIESPSSLGVSGLCYSHRLLLWRATDSTIVLHKLFKTSKVNYQITQEPEYVFSPFDSDSDCKGQAPGGYEVCTSSDNNLLALVNWSPRSLHVWNLKTHGKVSSVSEHYRGLHWMKMIALGHIYSIIEERNEIMVISTQDGQIIRRITKSQLGLGNVSTHVVNEEWLNDISSLVLPSVPLLYVSHNRASKLSGIAFI